ncbi:carbonic anhydrase [Lobosporangium transversale]|uniref:Carbonic anhydrase n=1 Tax=Lobosporangium transversale TaxID=64571 RepID=A0A1Y2GJD3_9FUNG|nr:carbonic anhydrase [Lobosporangium transversale]ORZ12580.1 carbonic anhydrase [Lobosporangium transversale]|eukprot:XP_021880199.1 carbonic anhydrase [Lobosporangium transversale]
MAANATEAIINKRLNDFCLDSEIKLSASTADTSCCSGVHDHRTIDQSDFPPISEEARNFSERLLGQNKAWALKTEEERPGFFAKLEKQQKPQVLWIGCSDSRVPANQIVNLDPGEIFVHRNIANVVTHTDMNLLSVLEYAVDVLKVRHIIVCGHYGCGGVAASLTQKQIGIIDNWLRNIKDLYTIHRKKFEALPEGSREQQDLLTELNVIQSALNVCHTSIVQKAWSRGAELSIHGWCYRLSDGVIRNLGLCIEGPGNVEDVYHLTEDARAK